MRTLPDSFNPMGYSFALRKNSPYTPLLNKAVMTLRDTGYIDSVVDKWVVNMCPDHNACKLYLFAVTNLLTHPQYIQAKLYYCHCHPLEMELRSTNLSE